MMSHPLVHPRNLSEGIHLLVEIEAAESRRTGDGIGGVAVPVGECGAEIISQEGLKEQIGGNGGREGEDASRDPLGEADHVGNH